MVFVKGSTGKKPLPRETIKGRLVSINSDEKGVLNAAEQKYNYIDMLLIKTDDQNNNINRKDDKGVDIMQEDGNPAVEWIGVRVYPTKNDFDKTTKKSVSTPIALTAYPEVMKADSIINLEKAKPEGEKRVFPIVELKVYKTLAESNGKVYKNYKANGEDLKSFKILA